MDGPSQLRDVFREHYAYVARTLARLGVGRADLDDATQEVFLQVHARWDAYDPARPVKPWLFGFAFRVAANHRRRSSHRPETVLIEDETEDRSTVSPEAAADRSQRRALLLRGLDAIDVEQRAVLVAHDLDDMSAPQIANALAIPENTVYSRLRTARLAVAAKIRSMREGLR